MEFFVPPAEAAALVRALARRARALVCGARPAARPPAPARARPRTSSRTTPPAPATSSTCSPSAGQSSRGSPTAATSTSPSTPSSPARSSSTSTRRTGERYVPHVIEPAAGADRATLAFLVDAYDEELVEREGAGEGETRTVLRLHPRLAPVKVAVLPLVGKDGQPELAREVHEPLRERVQAEYDDGGAIGKRYRRQDEIGTPFCLTIDHQSIEDDTVTLRDRDSLAQERLPIEGIAQEIERRVQAPWSTPKLSPAARARRVATTTARAAGTRRQTRMDFDLTDEQRLIQDTAREFTDREIVVQIAGKRPQPPLRPGSRQEDRRPGLSRRDRPSGVRRRGPRLPQLRPGRRGDRPRRLGDPHGHLGADLARVLGDPQVGHRGAEAQVPAQALLRRVARVLRTDRARHGLGRRQPEDARAQDRLRLGHQRREDVDLDGQLREGRADLRPDRPGRSATRASPASSSTPTSPAINRADDRAQDGPARLRHRLDLAGRRRGLRRGHARPGRRRLQSRDVGTSTPGATRSRPAASASARAASRSPSTTPRSASSSAARSRASSWCRR